MLFQRAKCLFYVDKHCLLRYVFRSIAAWAFFAQLPQGAFCCAMVFAQSPLGLSLCSRSSREGFSFLLPEQKKRNKENSPSALFGLLRHFSPLNKKNSLRSNSFLFFTLRKAPSLHGKKVRPDLYVFFCATSLRSFGCCVFLYILGIFNFSQPVFCYYK